MTLNGIRIWLGIIIFLGHNLVNASWPETPLRGANVVNSLSAEDVRFLNIRWNVNFVRLVNFTLLDEKEPHKFDADSFEKDMKVIAECAKNNIFVVYGLGTSMANHDQFFKSSKYKTEYKELWKRVANHLKESKNVAYDLMNEPHDDLSVRQWPVYAQELIDEIQKIDKTKSIVIEPLEWGWPNGFINFKPLKGNNLVYSFHFYGPMNFTHLRGFDSSGNFTGHLSAGVEEIKKRRYPGMIMGEKWDKKKLKESLKAALDFRDKYKVKMWVGEFGATRWAEGAQQWMKDLIEIFEEENLSWAYYSFREWHAMDVEMSALKINVKTERTETGTVKMLKTFFSKNNPPLK